MNPSYLSPQCLLESRETLRLGINLLKFLVMIAIDSNCFPSIFFKFKPIFHEKWPISAVFCWVFGVYQPNDGSRGRMIISSQTKGTNHLLPLKEQLRLSYLHPRFSWGAKEHFQTGWIPTKFHD